MRSLTLLTLALCAVQSAVAQVSSSTEGPPSCGLVCIQTTAVNSTCAPTDTSCICANKQLQLEIQECVLKSCSIRDQLSTQRYSYELCGFESRDRTALIRTVAIAFGIFAIIAFTLRCIARLSAYGTRAWGPDDWVMTLTMGFALPLAFISIPLSKTGLGLDVWFVPPDNITRVLYLWYFDAVLYVACLGLTKVSILLFYLTVFPKRSFRLIAHLLIAGNAVYVVVFGCLLLFQCRPISGAWRGWDGEFEAQCLDLNVIGWSGAAANIVLDVATIALPMPELFALSMSRRKKIQIIGMFALGFVDTIVAIIRLRSILTFGTSHNITQDFVEIGYMSTIEVPVGIICACLPAIRSLFSVVFPRVFGSSSRHVTESSYYTRSKSKSKSKSNNHNSNNGNKRGSKLGGGGGGGGIMSNKISVRQEWTVLSDPAPGQPDSYRDRGGHHHSRDRSGSDSDVELVGVGVGVAVSTEGSDHHFVGGGTAKAVVEVVGSARPETPWDGTIGSVTGSSTSSGGRIYSIRSKS